MQPTPVKAPMPKGKGKGKAGVQGEFCVRLSGAISLFSPSGCRIRAFQHHWISLRGCSAECSLKGAVPSVP